jgi:hypothetical protein
MNNYQLAMARKLFAVLEATRNLLAHCSLLTVNLYWVQGKVNKIDDMKGAKGCTHSVLLV